MKNNQYVQLPDKRFGTVLYWKDGQGWIVKIRSKEGRGDLEAHPERNLKAISKQERSAMTQKRNNSQPSSLPKPPPISTFAQIKPNSDTCPECDTLSPSYRSGVKCPNCEYQEHSFKQWLEDSMSSMGAYGNEEDPDENGLKRISHLSRAVPGSEVADELFGVKYMSKSKKSGKRRKSSRLDPSNRCRPNRPRT